MYPRIIQKFDNLIVKLVNGYANRRWYGSPITKQLKADEVTYLKIADEAKSVEYQAVDKYESRTGFKIDSDFLLHLALHTQVVVKKSDICYQHGRLLYSCLRDYIGNTKLENLNIVEIDTAKGFSAVILAKALSDSKVAGKIITYDVLPHDHKMYWNTIDDLEGEKTRQELLSNYNDLITNHIIFHQGNTKTELARTYLPRIHFALLDAAHDYYHLFSEFQFLKNKQEKGDVIFFDDYSSKLFPCVVKAADEICEKHRYSKEIVKVSDSRSNAIAIKQ